MSYRRIRSFIRCIELIVLIIIYVAAKIEKMYSYNKWILAIIVLLIIYVHFVLKLDKKLSSKILNNYNVSILEKNADKFITEIKQSPQGIDYSYLTYSAKSAFTKLYEAISKNDINICSNYLEKGFYDKYKEKVAFHMLNNERYVYKEMQITKMKPVGVIHHERCINDFVWFHIIYDGISYIQDDVTGEIVENTKKKIMNKEFWKFENQGNRNWKLCAIMKEEDADLRNDFKLVNEF